MKKIELAEGILQDLLDNGMISLGYGQVLWQEGREECVRAIERKLNDYVIVEGRVME